MSFAPLKPKNRETTCRRTTQRPVRSWTPPRTPSELGFTDGASSSLDRKAPSTDLQAKAPSLRQRLGSGRPLHESEVPGQFRGSLGILSRVRIHEDGAADAISSSLNASAFTR